MTEHPRSSESADRGSPEGTGPQPTARSGALLGPLLFALIAAVLIAVALIVF
ncbi:MAG TPA: hypothetical protein VK045_13375 [Ornithinicoccus sp.]|nr:hypothetical protein [Ornithinicoccus sp.]